MGTMVDEIVMPDGKSFWEGNCTQCGDTILSPRKKKYCSDACRRAAYESSDAAVERRKRYRQSKNGKKTELRYNSSSKGHDRNLRYRLFSPAFAALKEQTDPAADKAARKAARERRVRLRQEYAVLSRSIYDGKKAREREILIQRAKGEIAPQQADNLIHELGQEFLKELDQLGQHPYSQEFLSFKK
jgi:hypothetical protein